MTEQEFLELSDREQDAFIAEKVFGFEILSPLTYKYNFPHRESWRAVPIPYYTDKEDWDAMRLGVEKANEAGRWINIIQNNMLWEVSIWGKAQHFMTHCRNESLPLAFWIAYLRALGIIEE